MLDVIIIIGGAAAGACVLPNAGVLPKSPPEGAGADVLPNKNPPVGAGAGVDANANPVEDAGVLPKAGAGAPPKRPPEGAGDGVVQPKEENPVEAAGVEPKEEKPVEAGAGAGVLPNAGAGPCADPKVNAMPLSEYSYTNSRCGKRCGRSVAVVERHEHRGCINDAIFECLNAGS